MNGDIIIVPFHRPECIACGEPAVIQATVSSLNGGASSILHACADHGREVCESAWKSVALANRMIEPETTEDRDFVALMEERFIGMPPKDR